MAYRNGVKGRALEAMIDQRLRDFSRVTNTDAEEYLLGDAAGQLHPIVYNDDGVGHQDSRYWLVRRDENAPVEPVLWSGRGGFPSDPGISVWVGYDYDGLKKILNLSTGAMMAQNRNPNVYNPNDVRVTGYTDTEGFPRLVSRAIGTATNPSTIILISEDMGYDDTHTAYSLSGIQVDLASSIPSTGLHCLAHIWIKPDGTSTITVSTPKATVLEMYPADYQELITNKPPRARPAGVYRLKDGQTNVTEADKWYDGRQFLNQEPPRMNWTATTDPDEDDNSDSGYGVGSRWINVNTPSVWECVDDSAGAAVWMDLTAAPPASTNPHDKTITAGENLAERDFVYRKDSDNKWYKIDTNASPVACGTERAVVSQAGGITTNSTGTVRNGGTLAGFTGLTAGARIYASTTAGGYTQTRPTLSAGGGQVVLADMGSANSTTEIAIDVKTTIQYLKRESLAANTEMTIAHHSDARARQRRVATYISVTSDEILASYASSNQDAHINLSSKTIATYGSDLCSGGSASASTTVDGTAAGAFDDNTGTYWSGGTAPQWVEYDFGSTKTIRQYTLRNYSAAGNGAQGFKLQYYDGATWQDADVHTSVSWSGVETKTYQVANAYTAQRWRIYITQDGAGGGWGYFSEIEMMEAATYNDGATKLAQSFEISSAANVDKVTLWLKKVASPSGTMTLRIETDNSGEPSGTLADANATVTVAESSLSTSYGAIEFDFATNFGLSASTPYWLVLSTSRSTNEFNYVQWGADGSSPSYADGEMMSYDGSWVAESKDACFEVYGEGTEYDGPLVVGHYTIGTRDVAVKYLDASDANGDTNTTFKNVGGIERDITCIVELV